MTIGGVDLTKYRKVLGLLATGAIVAVFKFYGLEPKDLLVWGTSIDIVQDAVVDFLVTIGIPAVIVVAQPNGPGCALVEYWRWVAAGMAIVAALIVIVGLL